MSSENQDIFSGIHLGKWNVLYIAVICLQQASSPAQFYSSIFVNMPIDFSCDNVMLGLNTTFDNSCYKLEDDNDNLNVCIFDTSMVSSTFTSEFQLVCEKSLLSSMYSLVFPIGSIIGTFFVGASDKLGRVIVIQISSIIHVVGAFIIGMASYDYLVLLGRFLVGLTHPVLVGSAITLSFETMAPKYRSSVGFLMFIPFYIFVILLGVLAYFIREWRMLYLIASIPMYIIPFIALFLDKSPRWLIQQGRIDEAKTIMQTAEKLNKSNSTVDLYSFKKSTTKDSNDPTSETNYFYTVFDATKRLTKDLFGSFMMLKISLIVPSVWFLSSIVYYGVPLNANNFTNNPYLYIVLIGAVECPVAFVGPLISKKFGYVKTGISLFIITGGCMLGTLLITDGIWWVKWIFAMVSMICSGAIVAICNILTTELFPTVLRSTGYGLSLFAYYVGFFFSNFINDTFISKTWWAFNTLCGLCCIIAAILISLLPETQGRKLSETVTDVKALASKLSEINNDINKKAYVNQAFDHQENNLPC